MSATKEVQAPGEDVWGDCAPQYRAGYEAALRRGAAVRSPYEGPRGNLTEDLHRRRAAAWAAGHARGCEDARDGVSYARWQSTAPRVVPRRQASTAVQRRKSPPPAPGEEGVNPSVRISYRKGYAAAAAGKTVAACPHPITAGQITHHLRLAWLKGHAAYKPAPAPARGKEVARA